MESEKDKVMEKIARWKLLAEQYSEENIGVFISDINDNWYLGYIVLVGDKYVSIDCYAPPQRAGLRFYLKWLEITNFDKDRSNFGGEKE